MYKYILLAMLLPKCLLAQTDTTFKIKELNEVFISVNKLAIPIKEIPSQVMSLSKTEIKLFNQATTADLLQYTGQVNVQRSQGGGGSPVIRGFEANRVMMAIDGIRINNAIFRGGHLQNVLRIDQQHVETVEINFGPSNTMFGSDALGGVMNFITVSPKLNTVGGDAMVRYSTALNEKTGGLSFNIGGKKWASFTSYSFSDFGDVIQGNSRSNKYPTFGQRVYYQAFINGKDSMILNKDVNEQVGSSFHQYNFFNKVKFIQNDFNTHTFTINYTGTGDVPRYDRLSEIDNTGKLRFAEWYYGPEKWQLYAYQFNHFFRDTKFVEEFKLTASYQAFDESRQSRRWNSSNLKSQREKVKVYGIVADFHKQTKRHTIVFGADAYFNNVNSTADITNIRTAIVSPADTRYPGGPTTMNYFGAFFQDHIILKQEKWYFNTGLRLNATQLSANFNDTTFFPFPFSGVKQTSSAFCANLGVVYLPFAQTKLALNVANGFKTPNVDDLTKVFESVPGLLIVPNPDLNPENTISAELNCSQTIKKLTIAAGGYYNAIGDMIVLTRSNFQGQDSINYDGTPSAILANENKNRGFIYGFYTQFKWAINEQLKFIANYNYTYGRIVNDTAAVPLDHIQPAFGNVMAQWQLGKWLVEGSILFNGEKKIKDYLLNAEDNERYATPTGMPAWQSFNARISFAITQHLNLQLACENILDQNYRVFASGISAPGRNYRCTVRFNF